MPKKTLVLLFLLCLFGKLWASPPDTTKRATFIPLPIIFFSPETEWGFGAAGIYSFHFAGDSINSRPSQLQLGFAYTLRNQLLAYLPFQLFLKNSQYKIYGELGYYRYVYEFSGIGNKGFQEESELFSVNFPRVRLNALYQPKKDLFVGLRYWMDDYDIVEVAEDGLLDEGNISGAAGGFLSGLGLVSNLDTRDQIFYPSKGVYTELVFFFNQKIFGSDFNFFKTILDGSTFFKTKFDHIIALNTYMEFTAGDAPFNQLSLLGGSKRMRGYFEGALRDKQFVSFQAEYRMTLFWRIGAVFFAGIGAVGADIPEVSEVGNLKYSIGAGLRFLLDEKQKVNLRFDAGFGKNTSGLYITISEAF